MGTSVMTQAVAANDRPVRAEILSSFQQISKAFEEGDAETVKAMTSADHLSLSHYRGPQPDIWRRVAAGDFAGYKQTPLSAIEIVELAPGLVLQRHTAAMRGSCLGKPMPAKVAVAIVWEKRGRRWLQRHYQVTPLTPA